MTLLMIRVADAGEAALAATVGVDAVELTLPDADLGAAQAVRRAFPGRLRLRVAAAGLDERAVDAARAIRADEIAWTLEFAPPTDVPLPASLTSVAVLTPARAAPHLLRAAQGRAAAVMLEPDDATRLVDRMGIADLDAFAAACRDAGLAFGLAGALEAPDVARLLLLEPDVLGFDTAVRRGHEAAAPLDAEALVAIRALVPIEGLGRRRAEIAKVVDRIFVRDFEVALAIGAYQAEHGSRQRVRFSVETDVVREPVPPRDMRDVFSYDVIIETIRVLAERAHVTFVETLAEEVAASLLAHREIVAVAVKVEKLDVVKGAVGIEIHRRRVAS